MTARLGRRGTAARARSRTGRRGAVGPSPVRWAAVTLAVVGGLAATTLGVGWLGRAADLREQLAFTRSTGVSVGRITAAGTLLIASIGLGPLGAVLVLRHRARLAATVLFAAAAAPAILEPRSLTFSFVLIVAGILALVAGSNDHGIR